MKLSINYAIFTALYIAKGAAAFAPAASTKFGISVASNVNAQTKLYQSANTATAQAPATAEEMATEEDVRSLFYLWNDALATGDSRIVAKRYTKSPVLLATVSDTPRTDFDSVKDYFDAFLLKEPQGEIVEGFIHVDDGWASVVGIYEFTMGATGDKVRARYSYIYVQEGGVWKIQHHHSSVMPEEIAMGKAITESEVRDLFQVWNGALATLDPKKVASCYAKEGVLLPTVSDVPRTDFAD